MGIKMIAMDMDGTLLKSDNTISPRTKEALIKVQKQGVKLVLASGRSYRKLLSYAKELQMDIYGGYLIEVNGIALYDVLNDKREVCHQLLKEEAVKIFNELKSYDVEIIGMKDTAMYDYIPESMMADKLAYLKEHQLPEDHPITAGTFWFVYDNRIGYPNQFSIQTGDEFPASLNKLIVTHHKHVMDEKTPLIKEALTDRYWLGLTAPCWLEIMPKGVTKGSGMEELAKSLDIPLSEVMAFGDGENDIEILSTVGYGVAMGNSLDCVKDIAKYVCADNNHDGIAETIENMILSKSDVF